MYLDTTTAITKVLDKRCLTMYTIILLRQMIEEAVMFLQVFESLRLHTMHAQHIAVYNVGRCTNRLATHDIQIKIKWGRPTSHFEKRYNGYNV